MKKITIILLFFFTNSFLFSQGVSTEIHHICEISGTGQIDIYIDSELLSEYNPPYYIEWENLDTGDWGEDNWDIAVTGEAIISIIDLPAGDYEIIIEVTDECYILIEEEILDINAVDNKVSLIDISHATCTINNELTEEIVGVGGMIHIDSPFYSPENCNWFIQSPIDNSLEFIASGFLIDNLSPGTYHLQIQDEICGDYEDVFEICCCGLEFANLEYNYYCSVSEEETPEIVSTIWPATDTDTNDGFIDLEITNLSFFNGDLNGLVFDWVGPDGYKSSSLEISSLYPGNYTLNIGSGCGNESMFDFIVPNANYCEENEISIIAEVTCVSPESSGVIHINASPSSEGPFIYEWEDGSEDYQLEVSESGAYSVTVTSAYGCSISESIEVSSTPALAVTTSIRNDATCEEKVSPLMEITVQGGTPPYQIEVYGEMYNISDNYFEFALQKYWESTGSTFGLGPTGYSYFAADAVIRDACNQTIQIYDSKNCDEFCDDLDCIKVKKVWKDRCIDPCLTSFEFIPFCDYIKFTSKCDDENIREVTLNNQFAVSFEGKKKTAGKKYHPVNGFDATIGDNVIYISNKTTGCSTQFIEATPEKQCKDLGYWWWDTLGEEFGGGSGFDDTDSNDPLCEDGTEPYSSVEFDCSIDHYCDDGSFFSTAVDLKKCKSKYETENNKKLIITYSCCDDVVSREEGGLFSLLPICPSCVEICPECPDGGNNLVTIEEDCYRTINYSDIELDSIAFSFHQSYDLSQINIKIIDKSTGGTYVKSNNLDWELGYIEHIRIIDTENYYVIYSDDNELFSVKYNIEEGVIWKHNFKSQQYVNVNTTSIKDSFYSVLTKDIEGNYFEYTISVEDGTLLKSINYGKSSSSMNIFNGVKYTTTLSGNQQIYKLTDGTDRFIPLPSTIKVHSIIERSFGVFEIIGTYFGQIKMPNNVTIARPAFNSQIRLIYRYVNKQFTYTTLIGDSHQEICNVKYIGNSSYIYTIYSWSSIEYDPFVEYDYNYFYSNKICSYTLTYKFEETISQPRASDKNDPPQISITPNPTSSSFVVSNPFKENYNMALFSLNGNLVLNRICSESYCEIDINHLVSGIYIVKIETTNGVYIQKKIVKTE